MNETQSNLTNGQPEDVSNNTSNSTHAQPPSISLPKGGGAIRSLGEKFAANPVTGTGSLSVPIATSSGRNGFGPQLSLSYDSGSGNGPFGFGWSLSLPSITRKTDKGLPRYGSAEAEDVFILSGAEDLVPELIDVDGRWERRWFTRTVYSEHYHVKCYRPRIEGLFAKIEQWTNTRDPMDVFWRSVSRDNITTWYGRTDDSRLADPEDPTRIFSWLICETHDDRGNAIVYDFKAENSTEVDRALAHERNRTDRSRSANRYPKRIRYGNRTPYYPDLTSVSVVPQPEEWLFEVVFDYGDHDPDQPTPDGSGQWPVRSDPFSTYRTGFEVRTYRLCRRVLMFHRFAELGENPCLVRSTNFTYSHNDLPQAARNPIFSFLHSVDQSAYKRLADNAYLKKSMPPVAFEYAHPTIQDEVRWMDSQSLENLPHGLDGVRYQWVDLDGEGLSSILTEQGNGWFYKRNFGPLNEGDKPAAKFGSLERVRSMPSGARIGGGDARFMDLAGDGQLDLVTLERPVSGYYERSDQEEWTSFIAFESLPLLDWKNPNLRMVDLTGDGHADIFISEDDAFCWYPSLGETGFGAAEKVRKVLDEEKGPNLVFADRTQSVYLADISGDGLTDLVRIRKGEICYWPNLGYGRFGSKVTMDNAPWFDHPDLFDQQRIRLADIDGSGTTDIIYLANDNIRLYFNQSGNSWSPPSILSALPPVNDLSAVQVADLLGNGTACLVWSSSLPGKTQNPMRYIDLMGGQKPHLLVKSVNNLGAETIVHYAPSTRFYLADKNAGRPWVTRIPFPVHVVERVETLDRISGNRFVTRYAYHHGYFDGREREFRGFGLVEQWDTEAFSALSASGQFPIGTNIDASSHIPPVLTKTWYHTGAYNERGRISNYFAGLLDETDVGEYYRIPGLTDDEVKQLLLEDTVLPDGLTVEEERQACRALKGAMLRQEIYALDDTEKASHPYTVTEQNYTIRRLQPKGDAQHAVFLAHARESVSYHYERIPEDPRIHHMLTLKVDDFGNVLRSISAGYPRSDVPERQPEQNETHLTLTLNRVANEDGMDWRRIGLPVETRAYEIVKPPVAPHRFSWEAMRDLVETWVPLDQHGPPPEKSVPYAQWNWRETWDPQSEPGGHDNSRLRLIEHVRTFYRPDDLGSAAGDPLTLLPLGQIESRALTGESYKLAFTPGLVDEIFGSYVTDDIFEIDGRYVHSQGDNNWWIPSGRVFFSSGTSDPPEIELDFAKNHFFLPHRIRNPFHNDNTPTESSVRYDQYDLLLLESRDALDNRVTVGERDPDGILTIPGHDYRVLKPALIMDPNRNRTAVAFDTLGMVVGTAEMGKPEEDIGDSLDDVEADLIDPVIAAQMDDPFGDPHAILQGATSRLVYDPFAYHRTKDQIQPQPVVVYTLARETHVSDLAAGEQSKIQHSFTYSDGFGREIQKKIQAEPGPLIEDGPLIQRRWIGSGWTIFNNKGKPVRQYESFFSGTHRFEFDIRKGVSPVLYYDPLQRLIATLNPNHTYEKIIFDPWQQENWDVNDTVLVLDPKSDRDVTGFFSRIADNEYLPTWYALRIDGAKGSLELAAARKTDLHANTPTTAYLDSLGRTFETVVHNKFERTKSDGSAETVEEKYTTRLVIDIEGNQRAVIDGLERVVIRYDFDMLGNQIHSACMEGGERWMLNDVIGQPHHAWDSRGHAFRTEYDPLRRPQQKFVRGSDAAVSDLRVIGREVMFEKIEYGEGQPDDVPLNLRTRVFKVFDTAGVVTSKAFDFKGNLLSGHRHLAADYKNVPDWSESVDLEPDVFSSSSTFDAVNRLVSVTLPDRSEVKPTYNESGLLDMVQARIREAPDWITFVANIDYNAKRQRETIEYGNGVVTNYKYDPMTLRLIHLNTTRKADGDLQNITITCDPIGNVTHIKDAAQQTIFFANTRITPDADYTYDAINQLIRASGREHIGQIGQADHNDPKIHPLPHPNNAEAMRPFTESYAYDAAGNILAVNHQADGGNWTRRYQYAADSNRLYATSLPGDDPDAPYTDKYGYNNHGSMTHMPHLSVMTWDFAERMRSSVTQVINDGTPETTYYIYDATGQRIRKVTESQAAAGQSPTRMKERIYFSGFEVYREYNGTGKNPTLERESLHITDDKQRIALVESKTIRNQTAIPDPEFLIRYQLGNHLGSACLELDDTAQVITYEEYHPYGTSSYHATSNSMDVSPKRYRYTGKEKDEEIGLYYHGARYYAPWLGRWTSADPAGIDGGVNLYQYVGNNSLRFQDPNGKGLFDMIDSVVAAIPEDNIRWRHLKLAATVVGEGVKSVPFMGIANATSEIAEDPIGKTKAAWQSSTVGKAVAAASEAETIPGMATAYFSTGLAEGFKQGMRSSFQFQAAPLRTAWSALTAPVKAKEAYFHTVTGFPDPTRQVRSALVNNTPLAYINGEVDTSMTGAIKDATTGISDQFVIASFLLGGVSAVSGPSRGLSFALRRPAGLLRYDVTPVGSVGGRHVVMVAKESGVQPFYKRTGMGSKGTAKEGLPGGGAARPLGAVEGDWVPFDGWIGTWFNKTKALRINNSNIPQTLDRWGSFENYLVNEQLHGLEGRFLSRMRPVPLQDAVRSINNLGLTLPRLTGNLEWGPRDR